MSHHLPPHISQCVTTLEGMGFTHADALKAANQFRGHVDQAADYLLTSGAADSPMTDVAPAPVAHSARNSKPTGTITSDRHNDHLTKPDVEMDVGESPSKHSAANLHRMKLNDDHATSSVATRQPILFTEPFKPKLTLNPSAYQTSAAASSLSSKNNAPRVRVTIPSSPNTAAASASVTNSAGRAVSPATSSSTFLPTPHATGPPQYPAPPTHAALAGLDPRIVATLQPFLSTLALPSSLTPESLHAHAALLGTRELPIGSNSFIDVRDPLGKWLEAQVLRTDLVDPNGKRSLPNYKIYIKYLRWDDKWNEWIIPMEDPSRIASFRSWSECSNDTISCVTTLPPDWVKKQEFVICYFNGDLKKRQSSWLIGRIAKIDGLQVQVDLHPAMTPEYAATLPPEEVANKKCQRWYHVKSDLIMPLNQGLQLQKQQQQQAAAASSNDKSRLSSNLSIAHLDVTSPMGQPSSRRNNAPPNSTTGHNFPSSARNSLPPAQPPAPSQSRATSENSISLSLPMSQQSQHPQQRPTSVQPLSSPSRPLSSFGSQSYGTPSNAINLISQTQSPPQPSFSSPTSADGATAAAAAITNANNGAAPPSGAPSPSEWFVGQFLEVKDSVGKFLPAEVLQVDGSRIFIHYEGWSHRWDEWIHVIKDVGRIRPLGSALVDTVEEKQRKADELAFRQRIQDQYGFTVFDCARDGNCLFRAVSHQIYGTVDRYAEVRAKCYDYMERDRDYFSLFITEDFDGYIKKRRQDGEWGDHLEVTALRELFNKNVEIYNHDSITGCQPLSKTEAGTESSYKVPIIRLSFHGKNHYNSVIDPAHPPPLGDGSDSPINMRQLRQKQVEKEAAEDEARKIREEEKQQSSVAPPTSSPKVQTPNNKIVRSNSGGPNIPSPHFLKQSHIRQGSNNHSQSSSPGPTTRSKPEEMASPRYRQNSLIRDQSLTSLNSKKPLLTTDQLKELWVRLSDPTKPRWLDEKNLTPLLKTIAQSLHQIQLSTCSSTRREHLQKVYHEYESTGEFELIASDMIQHVQRTKAGLIHLLEFDSFATYFFQHVYEKLMWELSR